MRSRFAAVRVRVAHRDYWRKEPHPEQWLLIEWPAKEKEPTKYWLSNLPASIPLRKGGIHTSAARLECGDGSDCRSTLPASGEGLPKELRGVPQLVP